MRKTEFGVVNCINLVQHRNGLWALIKTVMSICEKDGTFYDCLRVGNILL
jgi:hypothetical protein